jgi:trehalose 6-phosphate phosphatase
LLGDLIITVAGSHGLEVSDASGSETFAPRPPSLDRALPAMEELAELHPGVVVERKPLGAALHFREAPEAEAHCLALASELAARHGLFLQPGKMVIELRAPGGDKGTAIRWLVTNRQMAGYRPVFIGDDITDEAGFVAAADLGGAGILVGPPRPTAARYRLAGVEAVLDWLEQATKS